MQIELLELQNKIDNLKNSRKEFTDNFRESREELAEITSRLLALKQIEIENIRKETEKIKFANEQVKEVPDLDPVAETPQTAQQIYQMFKDGFGDKIIAKLASPTSTKLSDSQKILTIANDSKLWQEHLVRIEEQLG